MPRPRKIIASSHLSLTEEYVVPTRNMKFKLSGNMQALNCETHVKVDIYMKTWNDPMVITYILSQAASLKPL